MFPRRNPSVRQSQSPENRLVERNVVVDVDVVVVVVVVDVVVAVVVVFAATLALVIYQSK
jgi:hypothetical protein